jgi:hypothetical protein
VGDGSQLRKLIVAEAAEEGRCSEIVADHRCEYTVPSGPFAACGKGNSAD